MTEQTDWRALTSGSLLGRYEAGVEDLETLPACTKPGTSHHRSPGSREAWKEESARQSSLEGRERAIVNQTNSGTVSKATFGIGEISERAHRHHLELN